MKLYQEFTKGVIKENPLFRLVLGTCPSLAITTSVENGIGMGIAFTAVLLASNIVISALRKIIPDSIRIPCYIVIIASFVTIAELVLQAFAPSLYKALGVYVPLIVVNCIILGRAEAFANKNGILPSIMDGLGMGVGFTFALLVMSSVREILGAGTFLGIPVIGVNANPAIIMILPPGGFIAFGCILAIMNKLQARKTAAASANVMKGEAA
jgi:electron transport complex protein RnfE